MSVLMNFNGLFKFRIAQRQKRLALQIPCKNEKPESGKGQDSRNIHQAGNSVRGKLRAREPIEIDQAHKNEPQGDFGQSPCVALEVARKKKKERHEKMK